MSCHSENAPFTLETFDFAASEREGFNSGLEMGLKGQYYVAGGPISFSTSAHRCTHWNEYCRNTQRRALAWKSGWKRGQEMAKTHIIDWTKPLRTLEGHEVHVACSNYVRDPAAKAVAIIRYRTASGTWSLPIEVDATTGVSAGNLAVTNYSIVRLLITNGGETSESLKPNVEATFDGNGNLIDVRKI